MAPFISGLRWFEWKRSVTKIALSQRVFEITRDFKFFSTENFKAVHMKSATSANRLAKSAIFWMKPNFFLKKLENDPNSSQIMSAGSGQCIKSWPEICSARKLLLHSQNVQKYVLHVYVWNKTSLTKIFSKKLLQNWKKIHIFSEVNPLKKIEKKIFFQVWNLVIFVSKNKTLRSTLPHTSVPWKSIK